MGRRRRRNVAAFTRASDAVNAATAAQVALDAATWPGPALKIRIGIHQGESEERQGDYFGPVVNIAARVEAAGHGGQTLMSESVRTAAAVADATDLGVHRLRDVDEPLRLFQLGDHEFPPLRAASNTPSSNLPVRPRSAARARRAWRTRWANRSSTTVRAACGSSISPR